MTQQNELEFQQLANKFMGDKFEERIMKAHFGVSISTITKIWSYIAENRHNVRKNHLLWTMHFLKVNPKDALESQGNYDQYKVLAVAVYSINRRLSRPISSLFLYLP